MIKALQNFVAIFTAITFIGIAVYGLHLLLLLTIPYFIS